MGNTLADVKKKKEKEKERKNQIIIGGVGFWKSKSIFLQTTFLPSFLSGSIQTLKTLICCIALQLLCNNKKLEFTKPNLTLNLNLNGMLPLPLPLPVTVSIYRLFVL